MSTGVRFETNEPAGPDTYDGCEVCTDRITANVAPRATKRVAQGSDNNRRDSYQRVTLKAQGDSKTYGATDNKVELKKSCYIRQKVKTWEFGKLTNDKSQDERTEESHSHIAEGIDDVGFEETPTITLCYV